LVEVDIAVRMNALRVEAARNDARDALGLDPRSLEVWLGGEADAAALEVASNSAVAFALEKPVPCVAIVHHHWNLDPVAIWAS
jgi:hypothetical protein